MMVERAKKLCIGVFQTKGHSINLSTDSTKGFVK